MPYISSNLDPAIWRYCYFPEIIQETNCPTFNWMWYKAFHDVNDRLYIIDLDESNSIYIDFTFASDA